MAWMGPCVNFWCMRFESRHRHLKSNAQGTCSSKNLLKTIAIKQVLKMCHMIHTFEFEGPIVAGSLLPNQLDTCYKSVKVNGIYCELGNFIVADMTDVNRRCETTDVQKSLK